MILLWSCRTSKRLKLKKNLINVTKRNCWNSVICLTYPWPRLLLGRFVDLLLQLLHVSSGNCLNKMSCLFCGNSISIITTFLKLLLFMIFFMEYYMPVSMQKDVHILYIVLGSIYKLDHSTDASLHLAT